MKDSIFYTSFLKSSWIIQRFLVHYQQLLVQYQQYLSLLLALKGDSEE